jgi:hypothetical protein
MFPKTVKTVKKLRACRLLGHRQASFFVALRPLAVMLRATRDAVRRAASSSRATSTRRGMSAGGAAKKPLDGRRQAEEMTAEQIDELSVFNAAGGLAGAAVGGIGVFVIGAAATLGVASGAASLLGAPRIRSTPESTSGASGGARRSVAPERPVENRRVFPTDRLTGAEPNRPSSPPHRSQGTA